MIWNGGRGIAPLLGEVVASGHTKHLIDISFILFFIRVKDSSMVDSYCFVTVTVTTATAHDRAYSSIRATDIALIATLVRL